MSLTHQLAGVGVEIGQAAGNHVACAHGGHQRPWECQRFGGRKEVRRLRSAGGPTGAPMHVAAASAGGPAGPRARGSSSHSCGLRAPLGEMTLTPEVNDFSGWPWVLATITPVNVTST